MNGFLTGDERSYSYDVNGRLRGVEGGGMDGERCEILRALCLGEDMGSIGCWRECKLSRIGGDASFSGGLESKDGPAWMRPRCAGPTTRSLRRASL